MAAAGLTAVLGSAWSLVARNLDDGRRSTILAASFSQVAVAGLLVGAMLLLVGSFAFGHRALPRVLAVAALFAIIPGALWAAPDFGTPPEGKPDLRVMTVNLEFGLADPDQVVAAIDQHDVDVVAVEEITPKAEERLVGAGIGDLLPYNAGRAVEGASGLKVYSRSPLGDPEQIDLGHTGLAVDVLAPKPFRIVAVHYAQPLHEHERWLRDSAYVAAKVRPGDTPTVLLGDFNSTAGHAQFRETLARTGFTDAAEAANSGWQPTWPARPRFGLPTSLPLLDLDHVLVDQRWRPLRTLSVQIDDTDHRALIADLARTRS